MEKDNNPTNKCSLLGTLSMDQNSKENSNIPSIFIKVTSKTIYLMAKEKLITFIKISPIKANSKMENSMAKDSLLSKINTNMKDSLKMVIIMEKGWC